MTYIQDKLDAFDKQFGKAGENRNTDSIGRWAGCDDCEENIELRDEHRKYVEQSLTDYHNHIVEEIKKKRDDRESMHQSYNDGKRDLIDNILSLLQDTNLTNS